MSPGAKKSFVVNPSLGPDYAYRALYFRLVRLESLTHSLATGQLTYLVRASATCPDIIPGLTSYAIV